MKFRMLPLALVLALGVAVQTLRPAGDPPSVAVALPLSAAAAAKSSAATSVTSLLAAQPLWRPAGQVLQRKANTSTGAPFGLHVHRFGALETLDRWHRIYQLSARYDTRPDMARRVYDAAIVAGIEPDLGFRLVKAESEFNPRAVSPVGAVGLTQLMLGTARDFEPTVTRGQLLDPDINLRIGFRYLRSLIREYHGNLRLALLVYNRGPQAVRTALANGDDPANGYDAKIMQGYRGSGVLD